MTPAEEVFMRVAKRKRWFVLRPSWPDFICIAQKGKPFAVEVKAGKDWASENQRLTFDLLTDHEVIEVLMWHRGAPSLFLDWERARGYRNGRNHRARKAPRADRATPKSGPETSS